jgi:hypothetical protein
MSAFCFFSKGGNRQKAKEAKPDFTNVIFCELGYTCNLLVLTSCVNGQKPEEGVERGSPGDYRAQAKTPSEALPRGRILHHLFTSVTQIGKEAEHNGESLE